MEPGQSGLLVPKQNPAAITAAVNQLLADPEKAKAMGSRGRQLVETKYNWDVIGKQVSAIYEEVLTKKKK